MKIHIALCSILLLASGSAPANEDPEPEENNESPEMQAGMKRLLKCRKLFADGKEDEAMVLAQKSLDILVAPYPDLRNVGIGIVASDKYRIVVHVNTSEAERANPKPPITRPYSFHVYTKEEEPEFLYVLDFEHGHDDGKLASAALGRSHQGHINYGMIQIDAGFSQVKKRALEIIHSGIESGKARD